jgi:hypothetical protein
MKILMKCFKRTKIWQKNYSNSRSAYLKLTATEGSDVDAIKEID